jgi:hypothetical protein
MDSPQMQKRTPPAQNGREKRPLGSFFHRHLEQLRATDRSHDWLNPTNVKRWKLIAEESHENGDTERMLGALDSLWMVAARVGGINRREAWRALALLHKENTDWELVKVSPEHAMTILSERSLQNLLASIMKPEDAVPVMAVFVSVMGQGKKNSEKARLIVYMFQELAHEAEQATSRADFELKVACCEAMLEILKAFPENVRGPKFHDTLGKLEKQVKELKGC